MTELNYDDDTAMVDIMTNLGLFFIICFCVVIGFVSVSKNKSENKINVKADYIITVEWDENIDVDVDTYLQDPYENLSWFQQKEAGLMHLDRDDTGSTSDSFTTVDGVRNYFKENKEVTTIRGFMKGEYILNLHMYAMKTNVKPVDVKVKIEQLNPRLVTVFQDVVTLKSDREEKHVCRFTLDERGVVEEITKNLPKAFVQEAGQ